MTRRDELEAALAAISAGRTPHEVESQTLDFKADPPSPKEAERLLLASALCFANAEGGVIIVGVADRVAGPAAFVGTSLQPGWVQQRIYALSQPSLLVDVEAERRHGVSLLVVSVPRSPEIHADPQGRAPRRVGTDCLPMGPSEQARLREEKVGIDWSAQPAERPASECEEMALTAARQRLATFVDDRRRLADLPRADLLRALGVVTSGGRLLRAGEVLFCGPALTRGPSIVYQYRSTPGGEPRAIERLDTPLLVAFHRALELAQARRNRFPLTLPDGQQILLEDFPELVVREALANAVIHRDYHLEGPVAIEHSPEVFAVASPGPLVAGVTPGNILTHPSKPRNPALARAARILGLAEEVGRGVDRMFREMIRSGRDVPKIESAFDHVRVTLLGGTANTQVARFVAQLPEADREDTDTLLVLFRLCSTRTVTALSLTALLQKSLEETDVALRRVARDPLNIIEPTRQTARGAHPTYRLRAEVLKALGAAVPYQRRTVDEIDRKVIAHVDEYGTVTNRTLQNLLDVGIQRARAILADLVQRHVLVKASSHQRGPGVEYGPGPRFPSAQRPRRRR
jgi:ATP-dependent DNA helicase RecG